MPTAGWARTSGAGPTTRTTCATSRRSTEAPHERAFGIVRSDGTEKPVAAALASFAAERRSVVPANDMPMISSTYYYRTLPASTKTLFDAFVRSAAARRAQP